MYKELIISIIIIALILVGDFVTQNYTKKTVDSLCSIAQELKQSLENKDEDTAKKFLEEFEDKIDTTHDKLAYYIEHDELEKVETNFTECKSLTNSGNYDLAISQLDKTVFVLEHITDKYSFSLENIF